MYFLGLFLWLQALKCLSVSDEEVIHAEQVNNLWQNTLSRIYKLLEFDCTHVCCSISE